MSAPTEEFGSQALVSELERLAAEIAAGTGEVDVARAMAAGRGTMRRRRAVAAVSGVAVLGLAVVITVPALHTAPAPKPVAPPATRTTVPADDPLTTRADFGWLPTRLTATSHTAVPFIGEFTTIAYDPSPVGTSQMNTSATMYVWSRTSENPDPHSASLSGAETVTETRIGTLNGYAVEQYVTTEKGGLTSTTVNGGVQLPAECETFDTPGRSLAQEGITAYSQESVVWRTPSGDWADIDYDAVNQAAPDSAALLHMAETVTFEKAALKMPFQVTLPAALGAPEVAQQGSFQAVAPRYNLLQFQQDSVAVSIAVDTPSSVVLDCGAKPTDPDLYATREINGLDYTVYIYRNPSGPTASLTAFGTASEILDHITSYGPDPANWTTHVIRH